MGGPGWREENRAEAALIRQALSETRRTSLGTGTGVRSLSAFTRVSQQST